MTVGLYSIQDARAACFAFGVFTARTTGEAERMFETSVKDDKTVFNKYPEDFQLYKIGEMDQSLGVVTPLSPIQLVASASHFVHGG